MLARIFSSVLLPEPLRPTMPKNSPLSDLERDVVERVQLAEVLAPERMDRPLLERLDLLVGDVEGLADLVCLEDDRGGFDALGGDARRGRRRRSPPGRC